MRDDVYVCVCVCMDHFALIFSGVIELGKIRDWVGGGILSHYGALLCVCIDRPLCIHLIELGKI